MKKREIIERIMRDDPSELHYNEIFKDPGIRDTYWKLVIKHHAIHILHKFRREQLIRERLSLAHAIRDWAAIKVNLDSEFEYQQCHFLINSVEEYQYLHTKGVDITMYFYRSVPYPKEKVYLGMTVGLECPRFLIDKIEKIVPSGFYHLQIIIDPPRKVGTMTGEECLEICLYDNISRLQYQRWTGNTLGRVKYYPLLKRQIVNRDDPEMNLDRLFLESLSLDIPELHSLLRSVSFRPSENIMNRLRNILGETLT